MRIVISNNQIRKMTNVIISFIAILIVIFTRGFIQGKSFILTCTIISLAVFVYELYSIYKITRQLFNMCIIFLISFYFFQNGQLLLLALGIKFNMFYINTLKQFIEDVVMFSALSNIVAGLAGVIVSKGPLQCTKYPGIDQYSDQSVAKAAKYGLIITGVVSYPLIFIKFFVYALHGRYYAVRAFEESLPSIVGLADYMFVPFSFLFIIFTNNRRSRKLVFLMMFIWFVLTALCGDRTTGISGLLMLAYINYLKNIEKQNKKNYKYIFKLLIIGLVLIAFIRVVFVFRNGGNVMDVILNPVGNIFIDVIEELGFSCFPLFMMMNIVPSLEKFQYGKQYLLSFFAAFFPSSLDFTGIVTELTQDWGIYSKWIDKYYSQYNFGVGFSLNAEAYINFGWFGIIAIYFLMTVVLSNLSKASHQKKCGSKFGFYKEVALSYVWMTLPRRSSYYIWNGIFWCVIIMGLYLRIICLRVKVNYDKNE